MHQPLKSLSLITATLLLSLASPLQLTGTSLTISEAIAQVQTTQDRKAQADQLLKLGIEQLSANQLDVALQSLQQALTIYQEIQDRPGEGQVFKSLGNLYYFQKDYAKAIEYQQQALTIAREIKDRDLEARALLNTGIAYKDLGESAKAIDYSQESLAIAQEIQSHEIELKALNNLRIIYTSLNDHAKAIEYLQQSLVVAQEIPDRQWQANLLIDLGLAYHSSGNYAKAVESYQQSLAIAREIQNTLIEAKALNNLGWAYQASGDNAKAINYYQQSLMLAQKVNDPQLHRTVLTNLGNIHYYALKQYTESIEYYQQALVIARKIKNPEFEWLTLTALVTSYTALKDDQNVIEYAQQGLTLARDTQNRQWEWESLYTLVTTYDSLGNDHKAIEFAQQGLVVAREIQNHLAEWRALVFLSEAHNSLGDYKQGVEFAQQSLTLAQEIKNRNLESRALIVLSAAYWWSRDYQKTIQCAQESLAIAQEIKSHSLEATAIGLISAAYWSLRDYQKMIEFAQERLAIAREINNRDLEATALSSLGSFYWWLRDYEKGIEYEQQALAIYRELKDRKSELSTLHGLNANYIYLGDYQKVVELAQQQLMLAREIKNHDSEGVALGYLGFAYFVQGDSQKIIEFGQQALAVGREHKSSVAEFFGFLALSIGYGNLGNSEKALELSQASLAIARDPKFGQKIADAEQLALNMMGSLYREAGQKEQAIAAYRESLAIDDSGFTAQLGLARIYRELNMPITAITYYKQAISHIEQIRGKIVGLPQESQESFLQASLIDGDRTKNTDIYRELADLLLSQERILEAQKVLELLKIEELRDFTRNRSAGGEKQNVIFTQTEEQILKENGTLIAFGQKVAECEDTSCSQLDQLLDQLNVLTQKFNQTVQTIEAKVRDRSTQNPAFLDTEDLGRQARGIVEAQPGTALIYLLVLEDKIWVVSAFKGGIVKTVEVTDVGQRQLAETVLKFRQLLENPSSSQTEVKATGKQLYDWLIKPIESELQANQIQNLVFSLDRVTRYIPISALFDGEKYLVENYTVSTVLSAGLTDTRDQLPAGTPNTSVLALGLSDAIAGFNSLPNVPAELDAIVQNQPNDTQGIYPGQAFLNRNFDFQALRDNLLGHQLLHIATHGEFVPGRPDESYLLLGTGEKLAIPQIATLPNLGDVQLVVLSACQTALGEPGQDGNEINGISYYFLNSGAKAVMASLWSVNDDSTRLLMENFYGNLAQGTSTAPITKAAALRQAQLSLLKGDYSKVQNPAEWAIIERLTRRGDRSAPGFSHPYYWAPFILIGNGL